MSATRKQRSSRPHLSRRSSFIIGLVIFAEDKARHLSRALPMIARDRPDFDLGFLSALPLMTALGWLERLRGVGRKVAAFTLNASTLSRPAFIVDTHVLRVLDRLGFVRPRATARAASEAVTAAMPKWSGDDLLSFHALVKRLGQTLCRPDDPRCRPCPLAPSCPSTRLPPAP